MDMSIPPCVRALEHVGETIGRVAGKDAPAVSLREILVLNYDRLQRRLTRHFACADTASDCLQEAWLHLGSAALPTALRNPEAYVYRVACNLATDQLRDGRPWMFLADAAWVFEELVDRGPGPDAVAEARSDLAALDRALENVPGRHRRVLVGLRLEELTREEVAARHGISLRSVDTALRQALDYCAAQTGRRASGGIRSPRRGLARSRDANDACSPAGRGERKARPTAGSETRQAIAI